LADLILAQLLLDAAAEIDKIARRASQISMLSTTKMLLVASKNADTTKFK
jgi:hypothetical protein